MECSEEVLTIVSLLSVKYVFYRPRGLQHEADSKKENFNDPKVTKSLMIDVDKPS